MRKEDFYYLLRAAALPDSSDALFVEQLPASREWEGGAECDSERVVKRSVVKIATRASPPLQKMFAVARRLKRFRCFQMNGMISGLNCTYRTVK